VSIITYGEIYEGIFYGTDPQKYERGFTQFLREVDVLRLNRAIMKQFARIRGHLRQTGNMVGLADLLIGTTALYHDLTVVTRNLKDFQRIPDLKLYQPH
jgi:predicted nucleic acid-binding protein